MVGKEILNEAVERRAEREKAHWKNMQAVVQNGVAKAFGSGK